MRLPSIRIFLPLFSIGILSSALPAADPAPPVKPNIIVILADDQRFDTIAALGNSNIKTPNLDRLVRRGVSFDRAYMMGGLQAATCMPSRAMLLSGKSLFRVDNTLMKGETWPGAFGRAGYTTFASGKWHNGTPSLAASFQTARAIFAGGMTDPMKAKLSDLKDGKLTAPKSAGKHACEASTDAAIRFLKQPKTGPFFCYLAFDGPHDPHIVPDDFPIKYDPAKLPLAPNFLPQHPFDNGEMTVRDEQLLPWPRTPADVRSMNADYYRYVSFLDMQIGRVLDTLEASPFAKDTIVVFSSDSGVARGSHGLIGKQNLYEHSIRVPLIIAGPGIAAGKTTGAMCYLFDVLPTLGAWCGVPAPKASEGIDFGGSLRDPSHPARSSMMFAYRNFQRAVRDDRWKLVRYPLVDRTQLFDLRADPCEVNDLSAKPEHAAKVAGMTALLEKQRRMFGDDAALKVANPKPAEWTPPAGKCGRKSEPNAKAQVKAQVVDTIDWKSFLSRHDMVWEVLPDRFENAAFTGNGLLGAMIFTGGNGQTLKWQMGRSDVAFLTSRIPIGDLVLTPRGKILGGEMRLDLWNAEVRGYIKTDQGEIHFRTFTHTGQLVNVFETTVKGGEKAEWSWEPGLAADPRKIYRKEPLTPDDKNPPPVPGREGDIDVSFQPLRPDGGHATAWKIVDAGNGKQVVFVGVGFAKQESAAKSEAVAAVKRAAETGLEALTESQQAWWHTFWPEGFVSIPDTRLESFYYIQMYKMASATRPGRPALDLMGPWFRSTPWAKIWWNLNIQLAYWPQLTGNRMELGESLAELLDNNLPALAGNAGEFKADSAGINRTTGYDCIGPVTNELCNLPWAVHNYWLQYRYSMDDRMLRERVFPLLKRAVNYYLHQLKKGPDGKLHISRGLSPEYPKQPNPNPDCNIDLALLRWGLQTLLDSCARLKLNDPDIAKWKQTLAQLTPYPRDSNGLKISASVPFAQSHRHYSHLLMIYPLYIMTPEQPENRGLVIKSLKHWMSMPKALAGYSFTGAASISALLGEGEEAAKYLNRLLDEKIPPNTLYVEAGPCIETPLSAAASLNDMLLSSWGDKIRVFPGVPDSWKDIAFHNLRTQGAFLVSASRKNGKTEWVRIKSLAGEPCRVATDLADDFKFSATQPDAAARKVAPGLLEIELARGQEVLLCGDSTVTPVVRPVAARDGMANWYGTKKQQQEMSP